MTEPVIGKTSAAGTLGRVLHDALFYDVVVWLALSGRERAFRETVLDHASIAPGESVLDIGCGTGTLAIAAKRRMGSTGSVTGVDASPEMIARALGKAKKSRTNVTFTQAVAESLPFPDARFDLVLSTVMLHHLPRKARLQALQEVRRVLKPTGRLLVVEFQSSGNGHGPLSHFRRRRHGHVKADDLVNDIKASGLRVDRSEGLGILNMYVVLAGAS